LLFNKLESDLTLGNAVDKQTLILFGNVEIFFLIASQKYEKQCAVRYISDKMIFFLKNSLLTSPPVNGLHADDVIRETGKP